MSFSGGWTAVGRLSWFFTSWVADLGPYVGPWPPKPPEFLPPDAAEIDYVFDTRIPDLEKYSPSDSYGGLCYRYRYGDHEYTLSSRVPSYRQAGLHLYVVWYTPGYPTNPANQVRPSLSPQQVAPAAYVLGGRAPTRKPGHWSDWIDGDVYRCNPWYGSVLQVMTGISGFGDGIFGYRDELLPDGDDPRYPVFPPGGIQPFPDPVAQLADLMSKARSHEGTPTGASTYYPGPDGQIHTFEGADEVLAVQMYDAQYATLNGRYPYYQDYFATLNVNQGVGSFYVRPEYFDGLESNYNTYFADHGLVPDLDFAPNPDTGETFQVENTAPRFLGWEDWTIDVTTTVNSAWRFAIVAADDPEQFAYGSTVTEEPGVESIRFAAIPRNDYDPAGPFINLNGPKLTNPSVPYYRHDEGVELVSYQPPYVGYWRSFYNGQGWSGPGQAKEDVQDRVTLPLSQLGPEYEHLTILMQPRMLDRGDVEVTGITAQEIPNGPPQNGAVTFQDYRAQMYRGYATNIGALTSGLQSEHIPYARYKLPRWRYWIPGDLACAPGYHTSTSGKEGRFSEWQPGFETTVTLAPSRLWPFYGRGSSYNVRGFAPGTLTEDDVVETVRAALMSGVPAPNGYVLSSSNPQTFAGMGFGGSTVSGPNVLVYACNMNLGYVGADFELTSQQLPERPALLDTLDQGVDYDVIPVNNTGDRAPRELTFVEYEHDAGTVVTLESLNVQIGLYFLNDLQGSDQQGTGYYQKLYRPAKFTMWTKPLDPSQYRAGRPNRPWLPYEGGTVLSRFEVSFDPSPDYNYSYKVEQRAFDLGSIAPPAQKLSFVIQPRFAEQWETGYGSQTANSSPSINENYVLNNYGDSYDTRNGTSFKTLTVQMRTPRWRYWIPGDYGISCSGRLNAGKGNLNQVDFWR